MKRIALAIILGLVVGWMVSRLINPAEEHASPKGASRPITGTLVGSSSRIGPSAPRAQSASSLDARRAQAQEDSDFSPYRQRLFSMDLVKSLSRDQLIEGFLSGQIRDESEVATALAIVAESDPKRALELVAKIPGRSSHDRARRAVIEQWVKIDANAALAHILSMPPQAYRRQLARDLAWTWGKHDPDAALANLAKIESLVDPGEKLVESIISQWAKTNYDAAEQWITNKAPVEKRDAMQRLLLDGQLANLHGQEAIDFILARPDKHALSAQLKKVFKNWSYSDPAAAIAGFLSLPTDHPIRSETKQIGSDAMMSILLLDRTNLDRILELKDLVPEGKARTQFLQGAANIASSNNIPLAERIIAHIPESRERVDAVGMLTELWMRKDHVGLSEWLSILEPSPSRDAAISRFVDLLAKSDPERAIEWAATISDEKARERTLKRLPK